MYEEGPQKKQARQQQTVFDGPDRIAGALAISFSIKALVMSLLASAAIGWRAQLLSAGRLTFCIFNTSPHVCLVVVLVFIQAYVAFLPASAVFGWQAQLPSAGGLNICIIIYSLRMGHRKQARQQQTIL